jgi:hypothetical protein
MNILDDNLNLKKMYNYQLENIDIEKIYKDQINDINNKEYEKYLKYLNFFFSQYHKKDKYNKEYLDGKYILVDKTDPNKKIMITPTEFIDIHKLYFELKKYSELFLSKISSLIESKNNITEEDREQFEYYKKKYMLYHDKLKYIDSINKEFYDEMSKLLSIKIEKSNQLAKYYQKRILEYKNINVMINEKLKYKLIRYFKENKNKIPSLSIINKISKENSVPSIEIEKWFSWIETVYFYRLVSIEIVKINKEINSKDEKFDINTKYMIIKKPILEE